MVQFEKPYIWLGKSKDINQLLIKTLITPFCLENYHQSPISFNRKFFEIFTDLRMWIILIVHYRLIQCLCQMNLISGLEEHSSQAQNVVTDILWKNDTAPNWKYHLLQLFVTIKKITANNKHENRKIQIEHDELHKTNGFTFYLFK